MLAAAVFVAGSLNAQTELVTDGGFEAGPGGGAWIEASTNFGTPICDLALCGNGTGTGPRTGTYWAWFGGIPATVETGSVTQSFVIPSGGTVTLTFWLEQIICDGPTDFLEVTVDGNVVFSTDGASPLCTVLGYSQQTVDISTYADGASHTLEFNSTTFSVNGGNTNFFIDDISVIHDPGTTGPSCSDTTTFGGLSIAIPDDDPLGVTDSQVISGVAGTLGVDVQLKSVCFSIDHTWVGDLIVSLIAPNGTTIVLTDRPGVPATLAGCDGDNMSVCVDVGLGNEMENDCGNLPAISGSFTAANGTNLSAINAAGGPANGTWQLFASDNVGADTGTILEWSLSFDDGPVANWTSPGEICDASGTINLDPLVVGTAGGTWSGNGVTGSSFDPTGLSGPIAVTYSVTDVGSGCSDSQTNDIIVVAGNPVAAFTFTPVSLTVNFTNTSTGGGTYLWDFGDTNTSTDENPAHTYAAAGTYTVTLTVTNACGTNSTTQTVTILGCPDIIVDGGFEAGPGSGNWVETSTNFGTPLCDLAGCGNGGGTGPNAGTWWAWFGGIAAFEEGTVSQDITIAINSTANLTFWLEMANCDDPSDFLKIAVDADTVYTVDGGSPLCGTVGYSLQTVNLDAYDDGLPHTLTFISRVYGLNAGVTNFFVDDIALNVCPGIGFAENNLDKNIGIMPVPARDYVNITFKDMVASNVELEVSDMVGKTVLNTTIGQVNDDQTERIDVSGWDKGVYMLKVTSGSNSIIRKIVIQ